MMLAAGLAAPTASGTATSPIHHHISRPINTGASKPAMPSSFASPSRTPPRLRASLHADYSSTSRPAPQVADPDRLRDGARARRLFESHRPSLDAAYADLLHAHGTDPYFLHRVLALLAKCDSHYKRQRALLALDKLDNDLTREDDELILAESPTVNGTTARTARHGPESSASPPSVPSRTQRHDAFLKTLHPRLSSADLARLVAPATDPRSVPDPLLPPLPASWPTLAGAPPTSTGTRGLGIGTSYASAAPPTAPSSSSASAQDDDDDDTSTVPEFGTANPTTTTDEERRGRSPNKRPRGDLRFAPDTTTDPPQWREWVAAAAASAGSESAMSSPILRDMPVPHSPVVERAGMFSAEMKHSLRAHLVTERDRLLAEQAQLRALIADLRRDVDAPVPSASRAEANAGRAGAAVVASVEEAADASSPLAVAVADPPTTQIFAKSVVAARATLSAPTASPSPPPPVPAPALPAGYWATVGPVLRPLTQWMLLPCLVLGTVLTVVVGHLDVEDPVAAAAPLTRRVPIDEVQGSLMADDAWCRVCQTTVGKPRSSCSSP
ncbi:hypothetical protein AMAG_19882, partial [Allomyces macrogynus ATCC 38327]